MASITFTSLASGAGDGRLPPVRGRAFAQRPGAYGAGLLPPLKSRSFQNTIGYGALPAIKGRASASGQAIGVAALPALRGFGSSVSAPQPNAVLGFGGLPPLLGTGVSHGIKHSMASGMLPPLRGLAADAAVAVGRGSLPALSGKAFAAGPQTNFLFALQSAGFAYGTGSGTAGHRYVSRMGFASTTDAHWVMVRRAALALTQGSATVLDALQEQHETLTFDDVTAAVLRVLMSSALGVGETHETWAVTVVQVADALTLLAGPGSALDAQHAVAQAIAWGDAATPVWPAAVHETLAMHGGTQDGLLAAQRLLESLRLVSAPIGGATVMALVDDTLALDGSAASLAQLLARAQDGLNMLVSFNVPDGQFLAWVLHAGSGAFTQYSNYPFNSFCAIGDRYYGATDTGIYALDGPDDAGTPIEARVRLGIDNFGTSALKRAEAMYLGYRSDGPLVLKVVVTNNAGDREEHWYPLEARPAQEMTLGRAKIGRGLKSVYWGFEVANVDGSDFDLDTLKWLPLMLERRLR